LTETKSKLEQAFAMKTFYSSALELATASLEQATEKQRILDSLLPKVSENVKVTPEDFQYLDAAVFGKLKQLHTEIDFLSDRHANLSAVIREDPLPNPFTKYSRQVELALLEREILVLLDIVEAWSSMRLTWATTADLVEDSLSVAEEKEMLEMTTELIQYSESTITYCGKEIQRIRECQQEIKRRFKNEFIKTSEQEEREYNAFLLALDSQQTRYLHYIVDIGGMKSQYAQLLSEINRILDKQRPEKQLGHLWYDNIDDILNFELWHFGDYPVTLYGVLKAFLILAAGLLFTRYIALFFKNRTMRRRAMSEHSVLLVEKLLYYTGFVFSSLLALWSLRIPLTAFAFLGGAMAIALGLGTQKIMGDFFCGLFLIFQKKLRIGDEVIIGGERGIVREITIQNTVLRCDMSRDLIIPNSKVHESAIINLTRDDSKMMVTVLVSIAYNSDVHRASEVIKTILRNDPMVLGYPEFLVRIDDLADSGVVFRVMFYVDLTSMRDGEAASIVRYKILRAFAEEKIEIPFPQTEVHIREGSQKA
ncbi:MAG: mechanosensitive ion channel, partial [Synergistaceae bacterium]